MPATTPQDPTTPHAAPEAAPSLHLTPGDILQLQFVADPQETRHYVRLIGYLAGHSLIVTTPRSGGGFLLVREDQVVVARLLSGESVFGFNTRVLRSCTRPYPYLHLEYPAAFEHIVVRKAQRAIVQLIGSVRNHTWEEAGRGDGHPLACLIEDLSTTGALISSREPLGEVGDRLSVTARFEVAEFHDDITLSGTIRNHRERQRQEATGHVHLYGVEFQFLEPKDSMVIYAYVCKQIAAGYKT